MKNLFNIILPLIFLMYAPLILSVTNPPMLNLQTPTKSSSLCDEEVKRIYLLTKKNSSDPNNWPPLEKLQALLGSGNPVIKDNELMFWGSFKVLITKDGTVVPMGTKPAALAKENEYQLTKNKLLQLLGKPDKDIVNQFREYNWSCENSRNGIRGTLKDGKMSYQGTYVDEKGVINVFMTPIPIVISN